jgi:hypothetical protein
MNSPTFSKKDAKAFVSKLRTLNKTMKFTTHGQLADFLGLKTRRVQAWMLGQNLPTEEAVREVHDNLNAKIITFHNGILAIQDFMGC